MDKGTEKLQLDIAAQLRNIEPSSETVMDVINSVGEDDVPQKRIVFGKRVLQPEQAEEKPVARARARAHEFHSIGAFSKYLKRESELLSSLVLADVAAERMRASIDESIEYDREFVDFHATVHPLFEPWLALIGKAIPVLEFALFVMKYRSGILEPDGRELALTFSQIKSSKTVTKKTGIGPKALNGVMVETTIGSESHKMEVELPEQITISVPLFLDTDPIEVKLDLLVTDTPNGIVVFVTAPELAEAKYRAFAQFVETVAKDTGLLVGFGQVKERDWAVVK